MARFSIYQNADDPTKKHRIFLMSKLIYLKAWKARQHIVIAAIDRLFHGF